jgi:hypothetical protein
MASPAAAVQIEEEVRQAPEPPLHDRVTGHAVVAADEASLREALESVQWERRGLLQWLKPASERQGRGMGARTRTTAAPDSACGTRRV